MKGSVKVVSKKLLNLLKEGFQVIFLSLIISLVLRNFVVEAREIPSESMVPTFQVGDRLIVDKIIYKTNNLHREDIIVFAPTPEAQAQMDIKYKNEDLIKRIIGIPGDKIQIADSKVFVNDKPLTETYLAEKPNYTFGPVIVPKDSLFVLGDNRNHSLDSHYWGFLPIKNIKGKAFFRYWPLNRLGDIKEE